MAMTEAVKDELSRLSVTKPCCRKAEVSALLRFAGGLHISAGKINIEVELDTAQVARRLRKDIAEVFGHESELSVVSASGIRKGSRYIVRVLADGDALARQTGLVDSNSRPIRGLPPQVVSAAICDSEAAWRGAFLAHGSLTDHLQFVLKHLPNLKFDYALVDLSINTNNSGFEKLVSSCGGQVVAFDLAEKDQRFHHDSKKLSLALRHILQENLLR